MRRHVLTSIPQRQPYLGFISLRTYTRPTRGKTSIDAKDVPINNVAATEEYIDPRPPWLFSASALLRVLLVPAGLIYGVFVHDFGEGDHVFMPPRRWWARQKAAFFTLSPEERKLVEASGPRSSPDERQDEQDDASSL
ncbi:hypothetical protein BD410DRAFT_843115 [Rickenella mellea]|uniref:Uncharacterized protein n=1 Tax=Rickenella mellea TaxID=50990 RepID=A0A4Y7PRS0_9AGAM|nr:hypothetical protein BD410DRAFT_843115 [Rickenella mellea]